MEGSKVGIIDQRTSSQASQMGKRTFQVHMGVLGASVLVRQVRCSEGQPGMSTGRAKPGSRPGTDQLFRVSDRVRVTIHVMRTGFRITTVTLLIELI